MSSFTGKFIEDTIRSMIDQQFNHIEIQKLLKQHLFSSEEFIISIVKHDGFNQLIRTLIGNEERQHSETQGMKYNFKVFLQNLCVLIEETTAQIISIGDYDYQNIVNISIMLALIKFHWDVSSTTDETFEKYTNFHNIIFGIEGVSKITLPRIFDDYTESILKYRLCLCHSFCCERVPQRETLVFCKKCKITYCSDSCREKEIENHVESCKGKYVSGKSCEVVCVLENLQIGENK